MLYWSLVLLVVAAVAGVLGFGGTASTAAGKARVIFFVSILLFAATILSGKGFAG